MKQTTKKILRKLAASATLVAVVAGTFAFIPPLEAEAASPNGTPNVQVKMGDAHEGGPESANDCNRDASAPWVGHGEGISISTTGGNNDMDCIKVRIQGGDWNTEYNRDFKLCLSLPYASNCTPWASEGGGFSPVISAGGHIRGAQISVQDRPLPVSGMRMTNVMAGVQLFYQTDNNGCQGSSGMVMTNGPESGWAYGAHRDDDPGCGRIYLSATHIAPPDADFVAENVPDTASTSATISGAITMRNMGLTWGSDSIITPESNNCDPQSDGETCYDSYVVGSNSFVLERVDTSTLVAPTQLNYRRTIQVSYTRYTGETCETVPGDDGGPGDGGGPILTDSGERSFLARVLGVVVPEAHAAPAPGTIICTPYSFVSRTEQPPRDVFINSSTDFPVTVGTPATPGSYELQYRMKQVSTGQLFGEVATVSVAVSSAGGPTGSLGLSCQTLTRTVQAGGTATYLVRITGNGGFTGDVQVGVVSGLPSGASSVPVTRTLPPNPRNAEVDVRTVVGTPPDTYPNLVFRASAAGVQPVECTSELIVHPPYNPSLRISPASSTVETGLTTSFDAFYDPDGESGPQAEYEVSNHTLTQWNATQTNHATSLGGGLFRGEQLGVTQITVTHQNTFASGSLEITGQPPPVCTASLYLMPSTSTVAVGNQVPVQAMYDPDGPGYVAMQPIDVSSNVNTSWTSANPGVATSQGSGTFRGISAGTTLVGATYIDPCNGQTLTAGGAVVVNETPVAPTPTLVLSPQYSSIQVGQTAMVNAFYDADGPLGTAANPISVTGSATWLSNNPSVATVSSPGSYAGIAAGTAPIEVRYTDSNNVNLVATGTIAVSAVPPGPTATFRIWPDAQGVLVGEQARFYAFFDPDGPTGPIQQVDVSCDAVWDVADEDIASGENCGYFVGLSGGTTNVMANYPNAGQNYSDTASLQVDEEFDVASFEVRPDAGQTVVNGTFKFNAYYDPDGPENGGPEVNVSDAADWTSSAVAVATSQGSGNFRGVAAGTAPVVATYAAGFEMMEDGANLTVTNPNPTTHTLDVRPVSITTYPGALARYRAWYDPDGPTGPLPEQAVTTQSAWDSLNTTVATHAAAEGGGVFEARAVGQATVRATYQTAVGPVQDTAALNVIAQPVPPEATLTLEPPEWNVFVGDQAPFIAWYDPDGPEGSAPRVNVTVPASWSALNPNVAQVAGPGTFSAAAVGNSTIRAVYTPSGSTQPLTEDGIVRVSQVPTGTGPTFSVEPLGINTVIGTTVRFQAYYDPDGDTGPAPRTDVSTASTWSSWAPGCVSSQGNGYFLAREACTVLVEARFNAPSFGTMTDHGSVVVNDGPTSPKVIVEPDSRNVFVGQTVNYQAYYDPDGTGPQGRVNVTGQSAWSTTMPTIAQSQGGGAVRGVALGQTSVRATYSPIPGVSLYDYATVNVVTPPPPPSAPTLVVRPDPESTTVGGTVLLGAFYDPDGTGVQSEQNVTAQAAWTSLNAAVASSQGSGEFRGESEGDALARATYSPPAGAVQDTALISVSGGGGGSGTPMYQIVPDTSNTSVGGTANAQAWYDPDGPSNPQLPVNVTAQSAWSSLEPSIASSQGVGAFRGVSVGTASIRAEYTPAGGSLMEDGATVMVSGSPPPGGTPSFRVSPASRTVAPNETADFSSFYDPDGSGSQPEVNVTSQSAWSSFNPGVASSQGSGSFRGIATGSTAIRAEYTPSGGGLMADGGTVTVSENPPMLSPTFEITPENSSVQVGNTVRVRAFYDPDSASGPQPVVEVTSQSSWSSQAPGVASSQGSGNFRGVAAGSAPISASYTPAGGSPMGDSGTVTVTTAPPPPPGGSATFQINPSTYSVQVGATVGASAFYDPDGSGPQLEVNVTSQSSWSSQAPGVASSQGSGNFRGVAAGSAPISASYTPAGGSPMGDSGTVTVTSGAGTPLSCTFNGSPTSLFIPPLRDVNLSWSCNQPASCTVSNLTDGGTIGSGTEVGSVATRPQYSTRYQLNCTSSGSATTSVVDLLIRVFDITTRIEILPR